MCCFFIFCYYFSEEIYSFLISPYADAVKNDGVERRMIFTALHETFITYLKFIKGNRKIFFTDVQIKGFIYLVVISIIIMFLSAQAFADLKGKGLLCVINQPYDEVWAYEFKKSILGF